MFVLSTTSFAEETGNIAGRVRIEKTGAPLAGANVLLEGTSIGKITRKDGSFLLKDVPVGSYTLTVNFIGYKELSKEVEVEANLTSTVMFPMAEEAIGIAGITVVADRAESTTPIAFTDVDKAEITAGLGSRDIPLVLTNTPSVYSTCQGGGAGDARVNIRGFNQRNVAVMINGVPINDMENGWVYWSNWDGLGDATSSIQVQRGLSAVNLAVPSIGGTMNILTDPTKMAKGLSFKEEFGDAGFLKRTLLVNTGLIDDKYAFSFNVTRKTGNGINDATWTDAWSYYLSSSLNVNENNRLEFYAVGAPQRHGQNLYKQNMAVYDKEYAKDHTEYLTASEDSAYFAKFHEAGMEFNQNWAPVDPSYVGKQWWNGQMHDRYSPNFINSRENFYYKPQLNLNWFTKLNEQLNVYSILYYSGGKGGGTGTYGKVYQKDANGKLGGKDWKYYYGPSPWTYDWNETIAMNSGPEGAYWVNKDSLYKEDRQSLGILRNSRNNQWTIGAITKAKYTISPEIKTSFGLDWRTAEIDHFKEVRDLLGGQYLHCEDNEFDTTEVDYQKKLGDKIEYNFTNTVDWMGGYAQSEYSTGKLTAFGMGGLSTIKYKYTNHFRTAAKYDSTNAPDTLMIGQPNPNSGELTSETDWINGFQVKGGTSYRLSNSFGVFANAGYVSKVPIFDEVISDKDGTKAQDPKNEKFTDIEFGFNFVGLDGLFNFKADVYYTIWKDKAKTMDVEIDTLGNEGLVFISGMDSRHSGFEFEAHFKPIPFIGFDASLSKGDWFYTDNVNAIIKDYSVSGEPFDTINCYVKDLKVGNTPQTQLAFTTSLYPIEGFEASVSVKNYSDFYADWDPFSRTDSTDTKQSWRIPGYSTVDLHFNYKLPGFVKGLELSLFAHVFNLLDAKFIQDATDNSKYNSFSDTHRAADAEVFFGLPRRLNAGVSIKL